MQRAHPRTRCAKSNGPNDTDRTNASSIRLAELVRPMIEIGIGGPSVDTLEVIASDRPLVTFALLCYNQERYVIEAIRGAFAQTYEPLEILLSDDCSTDQTFQIIQEMAESYSGSHTVKIRRNSRNLGLAGHMNAIANSASGELIAWAGGDDISMPHRISVLCAPFLEDCNVIATHSSCIDIDVEGNPIIPPPPDLSAQRTKLNFWKMIDEVGIVTQTHMCRTIVFEKFGPLDTSLTNEGLAMTFRQLCLGRIMFINTPTIYYRIGSGVSTYQGRDVDQLTLGEPSKVSQWRASQFSQMVRDLRHAGGIEPDIERAIRRKAHYYTNLVAINSKPFAIGALFELLVKNNLDVRALWAFVRRSSPKFVRALYVKFVVLRARRHA